MQYTCLLFIPEDRYTVPTGCRNPLTCISIDFVSHHVHLFFVVRTTKQLRVLDHVLITGAQSYAAHHTHETLFVEHALARSHYQFTGCDMITATAATSVHTPRNVRGKKKKCNSFACALHSRYYNTN